MEHPLLESLNGLTLEEIQSKISELNKKLAFCYKTENRDLINQLQLILGSYNEAHRKKIDEMLPKGESGDHTDKIDIS